MTFENLLNEKIQFIYKCGDEYLVFPFQKDHGDDSVYIVSLDNKSVTYKSYIGISGENKYSPQNSIEFPVEKFISLIKQKLNMQRAS